MRRLIVVALAPVLLFLAYLMTDFSIETVDRLIHRLTPRPIARLLSRVF